MKLKKGYCNKGKYNKEGKKHGIWESYAGDCITSKVNYINGKLNGESKYYFTNTNNIELKYNFVDDVL